MCVCVRVNVRERTAGAHESVLVPGYISVREREREMEPTKKKTNEMEKEDSTISCTDFLSVIQTIAGTTTTTNLDEGTSYIHSRLPRSNVALESNLSHSLSLTFQLPSS